MLARCAYPPFVLWIKRTLCLCEDNTLTSHTHLTGSAPLLCLRAPGEPNTARISSVCTCVCVCVFQEAVIKPVSPDVLYLFRVQAVCLNDKRSDFSQSMLFRGKCAHTHTHTCAFVLLHSICSSHPCVCFVISANTTRIFEGTRIVKTGMVGPSLYSRWQPCLPVYYTHTHTHVDEFTVSQPGVWGQINLKYIICNHAWYVPYQVTEIPYVESRDIKNTSQFKGIL